MDRENIEKIIDDIVALNDQAIEIRIGFFKFEHEDLRQILFLCNLIDKECYADLRYGNVLRETERLTQAVKTAMRRDSEPLVREALSRAVVGLTDTWASAKRQIEPPE